MNKCVIKNVWKQVREDAYRTFIVNIKYYLQDVFAVLVIFGGTLITIICTIMGLGLIISRLFESIPNNADGVVYSGSIAIFVLILGGALIINTFNYFSNKITRAKMECNEPKS